MGPRRWSCLAASKDSRSNLGVLSKTPLGLMRHVRVKRTVCGLHTIGAQKVSRIGYKAGPLAGRGLPLPQNSEDLDADQAHSPRGGPDQGIR